MKFTTLIVIWLLTISCSAQQSALTDQLLKGPFNITTKWQTIQFEKPLKSSPYIQYVRLLSCDNSYKVENLGQDKSRGFLIAYRFQRLSDKQEIEPEVFIVAKDKKYKLSHSLSGFDHGGIAEGCHYMGYSLYDEDGFFIPPNMEFSSVQIRANTNMMIDGLHWHAPDYSKSPKATWENTPKSRIIKLN